MISGRGKLTLLKKTNFSHLLMISKWKLLLYHLYNFLYIAFIACHKSYFIPYAESVNGAAVG